MTEEVWKKITIPMFFRGYEISNKGNIRTNWKKHANQYKREQQETWREHKSYPYHKGGKRLSGVVKQYMQTKLNISIKELEKQTYHEYYRKHKYVTSISYDVHRLVGLHHIELKPSNIKGLNMTDEEWKNVPDVLKNFIRDCITVNHKDNNSLNNDVSNLEFCTQKYNTHHYYKEHFTEDKRKESSRKTILGMKLKKSVDSDAQNVL
jgi:hypothetical protein|tara:strand:- start:455 stop:1075 length:621 start_codon:yes stop_codon:yes gene_type:complete